MCSTSLIAEQWQKKSITWFDILSINGSIYYSDTDNIVTNVVLPDKLVGKSRGQLKLEYTIKKAYFISSKTCCFKVLFFFIIKFCYKLCYHMGYLSLVSTFHKMVQTISSFLFAFYIEGGVAIIVKKKIFRCDTFVLYTNKLTSMYNLIFKYICQIFNYYLPILLDQKIQYVF